MKNCLKKTLTFLLIVIFLTSNLTLTTKEALQTSSGLLSGDHNSKSKLIYVNASSSYEYGLKVGKTFKLLYLISLFITNTNFVEKFNKNNYEEQLKSISNQQLNFYEELQGLAKGLNVKIEKLLSLMDYLHIYSEDGCTTTLSTGEATKNNETFLTQNLDTSSFRMVFLWRLCNKMIWIVRVSDNLRYAFWGIPILYEIPILNEEGLGFGGNGITLTNNKSRHIDEGPGISTYNLERMSIQTCKNVREVADLWRNNNRSSGKNKDGTHFWDNSASVWCDKDGGILVIEQTHNYIRTVFGNSTEITGAPSNILWHANNHQWLNPNLTGSIINGENNKANSSYMRAERARTILENNYGKITLWTCKKITRDHKGGTQKNRKDSYDICRHPDENLVSLTIFSWIIAPKDLTVYWTYHSPCNSIFHKHDFSWVFRDRIIDNI